MTFRIRKKNIKLVKVERNQNTQGSGNRTEKVNAFTDFYGQMIFMK